MFNNQTKDTTVRGINGLPSDNERKFWQSCMGILFDDPELPYNDLIIELQNIAFGYWKDKQRR